MCQGLKTGQRASHSARVIAFNTSGGSGIPIVRSISSRPIGRFPGLPSRRLMALGSCGRPRIVPPPKKTPANLIRQQQISIPWNGRSEKPLRERYVQASEVQPREYWPIFHSMLTSPYRPPPPNFAGTTRKLPTGLHFVRPQRLTPPTPDPPQQRRQPRTVAGGKCEGCEVASGYPRTRARVRANGAVHSHPSQIAEIRHFSLASKILVIA